MNFVDIFCVVMTTQKISTKMNRPHEDAIFLYGLKD